MACRVDIFRSLDLGSWLGDELRARLAEDPSLTHRALAAMCGYRSSGALLLITSGRRKMSRAAGDRVAKALTLDSAEREHLRRMIDYANAQTFDERAQALRKMTAAKRFAEEWRGTIDSVTFYRSWVLPVVRELTSLPDFAESGKWVAERVHPRISVEAAEGALAELVAAGYLRRNDDGKLVPAQPIIATESEVSLRAQSDALKHHQRQMMTLAGEALDTLPRDRRDMRVMTVAISEGQAARIKAVLTQVHQEILAIVSEDEPIEAVFQLNTQFFALTEPVGT